VGWDSSRENRSDLIAHLVAFITNYLYMRIMSMQSDNKIEFMQADSIRLNLQSYFHNFILNKIKSGDIYDV